MAQQSEPKEHKTDTKESELLQDATPDPSVMALDEMYSAICIRLGIAPLTSTAFTPAQLQNFQRDTLIKLIIDLQCQNKKLKTRLREALWATITAIHIEDVETARNTKKPDVVDDNNDINKSMSGSFEESIYSNPDPDKRNGWS